VLKQNSRGIALTESVTPDKKLVTIILHSGAYDRASFALSLAQTALASGMEVYMLVTFGGLNRFSRGNLSKLGKETPQSMHDYIKSGLKTGAMQPPC